MATSQPDFTQGYTIVLDNGRELAHYKDLETAQDISFKLTLGRLNHKVRDNKTGLYFIKVKREDA